MSLSPEATDQRVEWLDAAKGMGIALVVIAHILVDLVPGSTIAWFIYLFHMPAFFMISGYLQRPAQMRDFCRRKVRSLLIPYVIFLLVLSGPTLVHEARAGSFLTALGITIYGGQLLTGRLGVFWFVTCLFFAQLIFNEIIRRDASARTPASLATVVGLTLVGLAVAAFHQLTPLAIGIAPMAVFFLWAGYVARQMKRPLQVFAAAGITGVVATVLLSQDLSFDMKALNYGIPVVSLLIAVGLSLGLLALAQALAQVPLAGPCLRQLGQASLVIMFLHQSIRFSLQRTIADPSTLILTTLLICYLCYRVFARFALSREWLLGARPMRSKGVAKLNAV